jgi:hypothetical protein
MSISGSSSTPSRCFEFIARVAESDIRAIRNDGGFTSAQGALTHPHTSTLASSRVDGMLWTKLWTSMGRADGADRANGRDLNPTLLAQETGERPAQGGTHPH